MFMGYKGVNVSGEDDSFFQVKTLLPGLAVQARERGVRVCERKPILEAGRGGKLKVLVDYEVRKV